MLTLEKRRGEATVGSEPIGHGHGRRDDAARAQDILAALTEVSEALSGTLDLLASLQAVLEALEHHQGIVRSVVRIVDPPGEELRVEAGVRLPVDGGAARFRVGERITAEVMENGSPSVVPKVGDELGAGHRSGARACADDISFICTPISIDGRVVGTLALDLRYEPERDYDSVLGLVGVIASMIGQATRVSRLAQAERQQLLEENTQLREELRERYECAGLIGRSGPMRHLYSQIAQVAHANATVLIRGDSGTGKELIAHAIHLHSPRADRPFVTVNCAALPPTLIESELFGHEKGAFTGAHARKPGLFERACGGTLFLDEIGDLETGLQAKLLRVLQQREVQRIGGSSSVPVDVRVIAATHSDLEAAITEGRFREDLYYRLNVFAIYVPPLRQRKADIMVLAEHFVEKYSGEYGKTIKRISARAIDMLTAYRWPGNVRELENAIMRSILVCEGSVIDAHHLPPTVQARETAPPATRGSLADLVGNFERNLIEDALKSARGSRVDAAQALQTTDRILGYRIRNYGIDCRRFRD